MFLMSTFTGGDLEERGISKGVAARAFSERMTYFCKKSTSDLYSSQTFNGRKYFMISLPQM